ncbi:hypothetical protein [Streptomyces sp. SID5473]|nr:hypothetical protein [Streptomyces sp. SID5473]
MSTTRPQPGDLGPEPSDAGGRSAPTAPYDTAPHGAARPVRQV